MHFTQSAIILGFAIYTAAHPFGGNGGNGAQEPCTDVAAASVSSVAPAACWNKRGHKQSASSHVAAASRPTDSWPSPTGIPTQDQAPQSQQPQSQSLQDQPPQGPPPQSQPPQGPPPVVPTPDPSQSTEPFQGSPSQTYPAPSETPTDAPATGGSGGVDNYMAIVSKWRAAGGLNPLTQDTTLEANALKTANDAHGALKHELNPGTFAQVLAPGDDSNFESVYVGGWLCEIPSLPGLNGICVTAATGWDHSDGELGHAQILTSGPYSKIGCALATGIWACDLA